MKLLSDTWNWKPLKGYKTLLAVGAMALVLGLSQLGYLDKDLADTIVKWLTPFAALAAATHVVKK